MMFYIIATRVMCAVDDM